MTRRVQPSQPDGAYRRTPFSRQWARMNFAMSGLCLPFHLSSRPIMSPVPRTSESGKNWSRASQSMFFSSAPCLREFSMRPSSSITSNVATAAAQATALPMYVPPWVPAV
eukprot:gene14725-biopygen14790